MILANLEDISEQLPCSPTLAKGIEFLRSGRWQGQPDGRVDIAGESVYALIQTYETLPIAEAPQLEGHRRYMDLQYVAEGEEVVGWAPIDKLKTEIPYDDAKDIWFGSLPAASMTPLRLAAGQVAIFYPSDGHLPRRTASDPCSVKKVVVKVAVDN
jgi:biofilm protein TabA